MLKNLNLKVVVMVFTFIAILFFNSWAQKSIAWIDKIADMSGDKPVKIDSLTKKVRIQRRISGEWLDGVPKLKLFWRDKMLVEKYTRVALRIKRKNQRGQLILLPDSLKTLKNQAVYEIREDPKKLGRAEVYIAHGSLIANWAYGKLSVIALGIQAQLKGTRVAFVIDSTHDEGFVFLQQGSIDFPGYPDLKVRPMDAVFLRRGLPPVIFVPSFQAASEIRNFIKYNSKDLWSQFVPLWQKPIFYIPTATVGVTTSAFIISKAISDGKQDLPRPPGPPDNP